MRFIWLDYNRDKVYLHALSPEEVEFAWHGGTVDFDGVHPVNGPYCGTVGRCPSGRTIRIVWRFQIDWDGEEKVYVITAYSY